MGLTDLWINTRSQLEEKHIQQIIAFAGGGSLRDGSSASGEFRDFLSHVPTNFLQKYTTQCLSDAFKDSGLALQDLVNEIGRRLGFQVSNGRYRGSTRDIGFDGLWRLPHEHSIIIEVKTTDAFRIDLNVIAQYRRELVEQGRVDEAHSSILIIVGRQDTGDLEAQIRGSRHAWDIRLISVDALIRLMTLREEVEDQRIVRRMYDILIPREFTKLDEIVDILFSTAEEVKHSETDQLIQSEIVDGQTMRASFAEACITRIERYLNHSLVKRSRALFSSPDDKVSIVCLVSKMHSRVGHNRYWFAFRPTQKEFLDDSENGLVAFGCGSENTILMIPFSDFRSWLDDMNITEMGDRFYWHVEVYETEKKLALHRKRGTKPFDLMRYLIPNHLP